MTELSPQTPDTCWTIARAMRATVIIDADDYFRHARAAMLKARRRIMLIGWDFDARIALSRGGEDLEGPACVGDFIHWLAERNPDLDIYLLRWDLGALKTLLRGNTLLTMLKWLRHPRIHPKLDGFHPTGSSHHQKIVVIDDDLAFCGGIDMMGDRWDTRDHADEDKRRQTPNGKPHPPWHDATTALQGPVAAALGDLCRERWRLAGGKPLEAVTQGADCWPDDLGVHFHEASVAISRSAPEMPGRAPILEIEALYLQQIARAKRFIYAESQYFASRRIAEAIAKRLDEPDGPEIVVINPVSAEGWLEPLAMDSARARLHESLHRQDHAGRFRIYHPYTAGGEPIYVHAKILVIDDQILRVGSSNWNNRSLRLDTECDVTIDVAAPGNEGFAETIRHLRDDLIAEHLGVEIPVLAARIDETGSLIAAIEALSGPGRSLRRYETADLTAVEAWLADNEALDPEGPGEMFEGFRKRGLFRNFRLRKPKTV